VDGTSCEKREADQMYEPCWSTLHFSEGEKEQGKRHVKFAWTRILRSRLTSPRVPMAACTREPPSHVAADHATEDKAMPRQPPQRAPAGVLEHGIESRPFGSLGLQSFFGTLSNSRWPLASVARPAGDQACARSHRGGAVVSNALAIANSGECRHPMSLPVSNFLPTCLSFARPQP
jgi:hypothetical protein